MNTSTHKGNKSNTSAGKSPPFEGGVDAPLERRCEATLAGADGVVKTLVLYHPGRSFSRVHPSFERRGFGRNLPAFAADHRTIIGDARRIFEIWSRARV